MERGINVACQICGQQAAPGRFCSQCGADLERLAVAVPAGHTGGNDPAPVDESRAPSPRSAPRRMLAWAALGVAVVAAVPTVRAFGPEETHTVTGTVTIYDGKQFPAEAGPCRGGGPGREDLAVGSQITMQAADGTVLGVGALERGTLTRMGACALPFRITEVDASDHYQLRSQSTVRPSTTYSRADLLDAGWVVDLSVGDAAKAAKDSDAYCLDTSQVAVDGRLRVWKRPIGKQLFVWAYEIRGVVSSRLDVPADVDVDWEVLAYSDLLGRWDTAQGVVDDGFSTEVVSVDPHGKARFTATGWGDHGRSVRDTDRPGRFTLKVAAAVQPNSGAWCY